MMLVEAESPGVYRRIYSVPIWPAPVGPVTSNDPVRGCAVAVEGSPRAIGPPDGSDPRSRFFSQHRSTTRSPWSVRQRPRRAHQARPADLIVITSVLRQPFSLQYPSGPLSCMALTPAGRMQRALCRTTVAQRAVLSEAHQRGFSNASL